MKLNTVVQRSNDGISGWVDIAGSAQTVDFAVPGTKDVLYTEVSGDNTKYLRLKAVDDVSGAIYYSSVEGPISVASSGSSDQIYWGAYMEGPATYGAGYSNAPWDGNTWNKFEATAGKTVSICHFGQPNFTFNQSPHDLCYARGAIPFVDFGGSGFVDLNAIAAGTYDAQIDAWAAKYVTWHKPAFVRWGWEPNQYGSGWFPWAVPKFYTPSQFIAAWDRMKHRCDLAGATNMTWVWCPNFIGTDASRVSGITALYPNEEPDWLGYDGYLDYYAVGRDWPEVHQLTYDTLVSIDNTKPIMIGETSSRDTSIMPAGAKGQYIHDGLLNQLPNNMPNVKALVWFNWKIAEDGTIKDWQIESSDDSKNNFKTAIADDYFLPALGSIPAFGKVPVP